MVWRSRQGQYYYHLERENTFSRQTAKPRKHLATKVRVIDQSHKYLNIVNILLILNRKSKAQKIDLTNCSLELKCNKFEDQEEI